MFLAASRVDTAPRFPIRASGNGRYTTDSRGRPFPLLICNAWALDENSIQDYKAFLCAIKALGFTGAEVWIPGRYTGTVGDIATLNPGKDGLNHLPWTLRLDGGSLASWTGSYSNINNEAPDFNTPNEAFWKFIDDLVAYAKSLGLVLLWFPSYFGYDATTEGYGPEMVANGTTKCQQYGAFVGARYANAGNICWGLGGDKGNNGHAFTAGEAAVVEAFTAGIQSAIPLSATGLYFAEWVRGSIAKDLYPSNINLNSTYAAVGDINNQGARAWAISPPIPAFGMEAPFEGHPSSTGPSRRYCWWQVLSTIGGYTIGDYGIYGFTAGRDWKTSLKAGLYTDLLALNSFWTTHDWWRLSPNNSAITAGAGTANTDDQVVCASDLTNKRLAVVFRPPAHAGTFAIDMTIMHGATTSRWYDIRSRAYTADALSLSNSGSHTFTVPGANSAGDTDWVLELVA